MRAARRFWKLVDRSGGTDACWRWLGALNNRGYGQFHFGGKTALAHRVACELDGRTLTPGLVVDHKCRNPCCVNPRHLEEVTGRENVLRGSSPCSTNARKTTCNRGHQYDEENTITTRYGRECRTCKRERERERPRRDRRRYLQACSAQQDHA